MSGVRRGAAQRLLSNARSAGRRAEQAYSAAESGIGFGRTGGPKALATVARAGSDGVAEGADRKLSPERM